ncbi:MAG: spermidine synthase [Gammaproteobacteria bacterium]
MEAHAGDTICRRRDDTGVLEVVDDAITRTLYFGTPAKQSSMLLTNPRALALSYTRAMCACLLFQNAPRRVLLVGLGGGSLARFLLHHFPDCRIDAIEPRAAVIEIAREFFALPDDPRLTVIPSDGIAYLQRRSPGTPRYDLILVDAFDARGLAAGVATGGFCDACRDALTESGVLTINLWATDSRDFRQGYRCLRSAFEDQVLRLPVEQRGNVIALAFPHRIGTATLRELRTKAAQLEERYGLEFTALLRGLRRHNTGLLRRIFW